MALGLRGKAIGPSLRVDLPQPGATAEQYTDYANTVLDCMLADSTADSTVLALFTGRDWQHTEDPGFDQLIRCLKDLFGKAGRPICQIWWLGASTWRDYECRDQNCCSAAGRLLEELKSSRLSAELVFLGSSYDSDLASATRLPTASRSARETCFREFEQSQQRFRTEDPERFTATAALTEWESKLQEIITFQGETALNHQVSGEERFWLGLGSLLATLQSRGLRDAVLMLALTGRQRVSAEEAGRLLLGDRSFSPPWRRLDALARMLRSMTALREPPDVRGGVPGEAQQALKLSLAAALSLLGWIEWSRGRGSRANAYLQSALLEVPDYRLAGLLGQVLSSGLLCQWARSPATAWQRPGTAGGS